MLISINIPPRRRWQEYDNVQPADWRADPVALHGLF
jgi:hypothetical protein